MALYIGDFEKKFNDENDLFAWLEEHYSGDDFETTKEFEVIDAAQFDEDCEPVGEWVARTVAIEPIMRWTAHDSERGEDYGVPTGRHTVYWS